MRLSEPISDRLVVNAEEILNLSNVAVLINEDAHHFLET